jgi:hypothetical protein
MDIQDPLRRPEVRWGLGCLLAAIAMMGTLILVLLVVLALQPPAWVQVVLGVALTIGGAALAWLIASALGQSRKQPQGPSAVPGPRGKPHQP